MKMTSWFKLTVLAAATAATMGANAAAINAGTITVNGRINTTGCVIDAASTSAAIELGTIIAADFGGVKGAKSPSKDFKIHLTQCPEAQAGVSLTANGTASTADTKLLAVTGVTGIGLALYNPDDTQINLNTASAVTTIDATSHEANIPLRAAAVYTGGDVTEGQFTATTNFTLTYN